MWSGNIESKIKIILEFNQERAGKQRMEKQLLARSLQVLIKEENKTPGFFTNDIIQCKYLLLEKSEMEYEGLFVAGFKCSKENKNPLRLLKRRNVTASVEIGLVHWRWGRKSCLTINRLNESSSPSINSGSRKDTW